jgi:hypothetical protein
MGGAYTAYAEGIDGAAVQAASPAVREPFSYDWVDYDLDFDLSFPGAYGKTDFDNRGPTADPNAQTVIDQFLYLHAGAQLQLGELGVAATGEFFQYDVRQSANDQNGVALTYGRYHVLAAYGLFGNQLVLGGGARIVTLQMKAAGGSFVSGQTLLNLDGLGPEVGAVLKPNGFPFRLGVTARAPVEGTVAGFTSFFQGPKTPTVTTVGDYTLPYSAVLPWEVEMGFAFQLGPRPLNPGWLNPRDMEAPVHDRIEHDRARRAEEDLRELDRTPLATRPEVLRGQQEREAAVRAIEDQHMEVERKRLHAIRVARDKNWPRERILVVGSMLVTGASDNAVSLDGFVRHSRELVGQTISLSPRIGVESEPVVNWLHARVGSYIEPSRYEDGHPRQHFTFGGDVRLFAFSPWGIFGDQVWRLSISADLAPRYQNFGLGIGAWH